MWLSTDQGFTRNGKSPYNDTRKNVYRPEKGNLPIVSPWSLHPTHIPPLLQRLQEETGTSSNLKKDWPTYSTNHPERLTDGQ